MVIGANLRGALLFVGIGVVFFTTRFLAVAADPPTSDEQATATELSEPYFKFKVPTGFVALMTPAATNFFLVGSSGAVFWKWTAPTNGGIILKNGAQTAMDPPSTVTFYLAWPLPTNDDPKGVSGNQEIALRDGSGTGPGNGGGLVDIQLRPPLPGFAGDLRIYSTNDAGSLVEVGGLGNDLSGYFTVRSGQVLFLRIQPPWLALENGPGSFLFTPAPANGAFADRMPLVGVAASATGHNIGATAEVNDPATNGPAGNPVWWTWTAPDYGNAIFAVNNPGLEIGSDSTNNFLLSFYKGSALGSLLLVGTTTNVVKLPVAPGDTFQIAVDSLGDVGTYSFSVFLDFLPPAIDPVSSRRMDDGSFRIDARQLRGRPFSVVASEDGIYWEPIWSGVVNGDTATFRDYGATSRTNVFYYLRLPKSYQYWGGAAIP